MGWRIARLLAGLVFVLGMAPRVASAHAASRATFTLDSHFAANAQAAATQQEPGYIAYNDCAHWLSWFLEAKYGLPGGWGHANASALIQNLVDAGIATVVTGDQQPDAGSLISESDAARQYFSDDDSYPAALDRFMADTIGDEEFILAYKWNDDTSSNVYSHVALYVGNGQVVAHGTTTDGTFATEENTTPQAWNWYLNPSDGENDWQVAILALHSGTVNPPPTPAAAPDSSWTVTLAADQTDVTPGTVVNLTAQASQAVDNTGASIDIIDETDAVVVASCTTGDSCSAQVTVDVDDTISYIAQIGSAVQSDPQAVLWEDNPSSGGDTAGNWSVTLTADQTDLQAGDTVNLTAQASQDVGPTPYSIAIVDQGNGNTITTCGSGSSCAGSDSYDSADSETYVAEIVDESGNVVAQSDPQQVTWEGASSGDTGSTGTDLGGVDLNGYCQSLGDQGVSLDGSTAYDWHCVDPAGNHLSIDMDAACQWQYSDPNAVSVLGDVNDPKSWSCQDGS